MSLTADVTTSRRYSPRGGGIARGPALTLTSQRNTSARSSRHQ